MRIRRLLPEWILSPLHALRRAFLLRRRRFALHSRPDGSFAVGEGGQWFPHRRVRLRLDSEPDASSLHLSGRRFGGAAWEMWLERVPGRAELEVDLPYGLSEVALRILPPPAGRPPRCLELREIGVLQTRRQSVAVEYTRWLDGFEVPSPAAVERLRARAASTGLVVSVVGSPGTKGGDSLAAQLPGQVALCRDLADAAGDIVVLVPEDVVPVPYALPLLVCAFDADRSAELIYGDDDWKHGEGRSDPSFRPIWSPELLRARNFAAGLLAIRPSLLTDDRRRTLKSKGRYAFLLACSAEVPPERLVRVPIVLASVTGAHGESPAVESAVLSEHLKQAGIEARVEPGLAPHSRRVRYGLPSPVPRVSIIVPTRDAHRLVELCIDSVRRLTAYASYEIVLVDNASSDPAALAAFDALSRSGKVRLLHDPRPFNFSALNNAAVAAAEGEVLCLLNNDVEATHPDWLEEMVAVALQPGVGAVGAKLLYRDGRIQHGGILLGFNGAAENLYAGCEGAFPGHDRQLLVRREVSAVTAACLVVRRSLYEGVGGLDADNFPVAFNDVDFCLKLRARGLRNVWTPHARLVHHESASRGRRRLQPEVDPELTALRAKWGRELMDDPYLSPNLSLDSKRPRLAWPPRGRMPWSN